MNQLNKIFLCSIFLISCTGSQNVTQIPIISVTKTSETTIPSQELLPLIPSTTVEPFERVLSGTSLPAIETVISQDNVNSIVELARWGDGVIQKIIVSSDGKFSIIGSSIGFYVYSNEKLEVINFIELSSDIGGLALSPDDKILAVGTREKVLIYEIENFNVIKNIQRSATNLTFSPDGKMLAMGMGDWHFCRERGPIELWDVNTWTLLQTIDEADCIGDLIFSPSGKYLAFSNFYVTVWEIVSEEESILKFTGSGCSNLEKNLAFTSDEEILITESFANSGRDKICLIRMKDGKALGVLENDSQVDYSCEPNIATSADGRFMASNLEGKIVIWQVDEWKQIHALGDGNECFSSAGWLPDNKTLITLSNKQLQIWDVPNEKLVHSEFLSQQTLPINIIDWSPDGKTIATANSDGVISLWQASKGNVFSQLENQGNITSIEFSPDSELLAVGLEADSANIWNLTTEIVTQTLRGTSQYGSTDVAFSKDGTLLALDIFDNDPQLDTDDLQVWKTDTWLPLFTLTADGFFTDLSISSDNRLLAVTNSDGVIKVWSIKTREMLYEFKFLKGGSRVISIDFSPNSDFLAASGRDASVAIWDLTSGELIAFYENPDSDYDNWKGVYFLYNYDNVEWSPNGQLIAASMPDGNIHLLNPSDGTVLKKLVGHTLWATGVTFSPDGKMLASSSFDGTVRLWGIAP